MTIGGYAEVLLDSPSDGPSPHVPEYAAQIQQGVRTQAKIIEALLLLAHTRADDVPLQSLEMGAIVTEALARQAAEIEETSAEIVLPDAWPAALGYSPWVEEVWANYLSNAMLYGGRLDLTPPLPPRVEVGGVAQPDGWVRFSGARLGARHPCGGHTAFVCPVQQIDPEPLRRPRVAWVFRSCGALLNDSAGRSRSKARSVRAAPSPSHFPAPLRSRARAFLTQALRRDSICVQSANGRLLRLIVIRHHAR